MSYRHIHTTSTLAYERDEDRIYRFIAALRAVSGGFFTFVEPAVVQGRIVAVVMGSKDLDNISDELGMPEIAESLAGILENDITIVSAWEWRDHGDGVRERECVFPVRGSKNAGRVIDGEVGLPEIAAADA